MQRSPMEPSTSASTDDSLDSFFMSLAIGLDGKTLETSLPGMSWDTAKIMQDGIAQSSPKLFARGFEALVDRVLHGIEPKEEDSCKEEGKRESKFLHRFDAKGEGPGNEDVVEKVKAFSWREADKEETYKIDLADIGGWVMCD